MTGLGEVTAIIVARKGSVRIKSKALCDFRRK
jgi:CMP-N-acetylneuraminic acid synthetase